MGAVSDLISSSKFPCIMAKGLVKSNSLVEEEVAYDSPTVADDICEIVRNYESTYISDSRSLYSLSIEIRNSPIEFEASFEKFERYFWNLVGKFRSVSPSADISDNPEDTNFRLSVGGSSYFLILLHPNSSRLARRSKKPAIVFNRHEQFEWLKSTGVFESVRDKIRTLNIDLQGYGNPMLQDFGESSEIYQYSGRDYTAMSQCPFSKFRGWLRWKK